MSENNLLFMKKIKTLRLMDYNGVTLFFKPSWHLFRERSEKEARVSLTPEQMRSVLKYAVLNTDILSQNGKKISIVIPSKDYSYNMALLVSIEGNLLVVVTMCDIPENGFSETMFKDIESFVIKDYVWKEKKNELAKLNFGQAMEMYCSTLVHEVDKRYKPERLEVWDSELYGDNLFSLVNSNKLYLPTASFINVNMTLTIDEVIHALNHSILYSNLTHDGIGKRVVIFPNKKNSHYIGILVNVLDEYIEFLGVCDKGHTYETKHIIYRVEKQMFLDGMLYIKQADDRFIPQGSEEEIFKQVLMLLEENPKHRFSIVATCSTKRTNKGGNMNLLLKDIYVNNHFFCGSMWIPMKSRLDILQNGDVFSAVATPYIYKNNIAKNLSSVTLNVIRDINILNKK